MEQSNKELLIRDLCARLPYGVKVHINFPREKVYTLSSIQKDTFTEEFKCKFEEYPQSTCIDERVQPYLFPMSSMTKEQKIEYARLWEDYSDKHFDAAFSGDVNYDIDMYKLPVDYHVIDYLNAHHFDFRNLIDRDLAIDCTNLNIY